MMDERMLDGLEKALTVSFATLQLVYRKPDDLMEANRKVFEYIKELRSQLTESKRRQVQMENALPQLRKDLLDTLRDMEGKMSKFSFAFRAEPGPAPLIPEKGGA